MTRLHQLYARIGKVGLYKRERLVSRDDNIEITEVTKGQAHESKSTVHLKSPRGGKRIIKYKYKLFNDEIEQMLKIDWVDDICVLLVEKLLRLKSFHKMIFFKSFITIFENMLPCRWMIRTTFGKLILLRVGV